MRYSREHGIAMITTLLVLMLISALLVGFTAVVMSDQRFRFIDRDRGQAFYAASGALEKLTANLGNTFFSFVAPTNAQVTAITTTPPAVPGVTYTAVNPPSALPSSVLTAAYCFAPNSPRTVGSNGYTVMFCGNAAGNPAATNSMPVKTGPYAGLVALQTPYQLDVTARTTTGGEVHLIRTMEAVAIPVFQFGMFSDVDLAFFAGADFGFGGRVHTNGNLFLSEGGGATLTLSDKVTAVGEIVRQRLQNTVPITVAPTHDGTVNMATAPGLFRPLLANEGSVTDGLGSALNGNWTTISLSTYNSYIRNGRTGAKVLSLPLITVGGTNPDLIRRPPVGEDTTNAVLFNERMFTKASLRILLSDTAADILNLPTVTNVAPVQLEGNWNTGAVPGPPPAYGPVSGATVNFPNPPIALSPGAQSVITGAPTANPWNTLSVVANAIPQYFRPYYIPGYLPPTAGALTVGNPGNPKQVTTSCWGRTFNTFLRCTSNLALGQINSGESVTMTINGQQVKTTLSANYTPTVLAGGNTMNVVNGETGRFAPSTFWVNSGGASYLVSCAGSDVTGSQFTNCAGLPTFPLPVGATITTNALSNAATSATTGGLLGGFIKIEKQDNAGTWTDVTMQILNYGIGAPNEGGPPGGLAQGQLCADPTPNAILRMERLKENAGGTPTTNGGGCNYGPGPQGGPNYLDAAGYKDPTNWWPQVLFDTREALQRDNVPAVATQFPLGGVMHYIAIDAANLSNWFMAAAPYGAGGGATAKKDNGGFTVYFSDRRNNRTSLSAETGEYGWEDFVNPADAANGAPNGVLDPGEDLNANGVLDVYGGIPNYQGVYNAAPPGAAAPLNGASRPTTTLLQGQAMVNRPILFRHALKLINGSNIAASLITGLTVVAENPVYIQGDWNAPGGGFNNPHAATSVIADAVTLLSNNWQDLTSFAFPYAPAGNRSRLQQTWYRLAIIGGKGAAFAQPAGTATDFGTDGGAHNFLRFLEDGDQPVNYQGAIATFFYNRQAVGTFKCCTTVYGAPRRNFAFDVDFLTPALLPPNTPVFRDMNAVGFSQELRPGK